MIIYALFLSMITFAEQKIELEAGIRTETNAFYKDRDKELDFASYIKPHANLMKKFQTGSLYASGGLNYSKYMSNDVLDNIEYSVVSGFDKNIGEKWSFGVDGHYDLLSEPPDNKDGENFEKNIAGGTFRISYQYSDLVSHHLDVYGKNYSFNESDYDYMVNQKLGSKYKMRYFFLPETSFLILADSEMSTYPDGRKNLLQDAGTTKYLNNSMSYYLAAGLEGRLTEYSQFYFSFGYLVKNYEYGSSYNEPVFEVNFQEQITPQDTLLAGYTYRVLDSFYTNYELNQNMYLGYSRVFGDRIILLFRSNYHYKTYSLPNRREDQQLFGTVQVDFSYKPNWLIKAGFSGDILISDSINQQVSVDVADPATSYESFHIFLATKVIF